MKDTQHHDAIETMARSLQQSEGLGIAPSDSRGWPGHIRDQGKDWKARSSSLSPITIRGGDVGVPGNHACARAGCYTRVLPGIAANIEHRLGAQQLHGSLENVNVQNVPGVGHLTIEKNEIMQRRVISDIDAVVFGSRPREVSAAPGATR